MGVAARLDDDVRPRGGGEVEGHHRGRAPVEGEGRLRHPLVAQRHEIREAISLLGLEDRDRVTIGAWFEGGVAHARGAFAGRLARLGPLLRSNPRARGPGVACRCSGLPRAVDRSRRRHVRVVLARPSGGHAWFAHLSRPPSTSPAPPPPASERVASVARDTVGVMSIRCLVMVGPQPARCRPPVRGHLADRAPERGRELADPPCRRGEADRPGARTRRRAERLLRRPAPVDRQDRARHQARGAGRQEDDGGRDIRGRAHPADGDPGQDPARNAGSSSRSAVPGV